jgi:hypothetical protein
MLGHPSDVPDKIDGEHPSEMARLGPLWNVTWCWWRAKAPPDLRGYKDATAAVMLPKTKVADSHRGAHATRDLHAGRFDRRASRNGRAGDEFWNKEVTPIWKRSTTAIMTWPSRYKEIR